MICLQKSVKKQQKTKIYLQQGSKEHNTIIKTIQSSGAIHTIRSTTEYNKSYKNKTGQPTAQVLPEQRRVNNRGIIPPWPYMVNTWHESWQRLVWWLVTPSPVGLDVQKNPRLAYDAQLTEFLGMSLSSSKERGLASFNPLVIKLPFFFFFFKFLASKCCRLGKGSGRHQSSRAVITEHCTLLRRVQTTGLA